MCSEVKLSLNILENAKKAASQTGKSIPEQIEHWSKIGKVAEENPDLTYRFIKGILLSLEEAKYGEIKEYKPGN